jgi:hypothetical protein
VPLALLTVVLATSCAQVLGITDRGTCSTDLVYCDGECVDALTDARHCGGCGNSYNGASCVDGQCMDPDCSHEFASCVTPGSITAECGGLDCLEFPALTKPVCLRRCASNDDCPYDMFCAPGDGGYASGFPSYVLVAGHCMPSFCGGAASQFSHNGTANGACDVGGDAYLAPGAIATRPGSS